ncbi:hypothetical protein T09_15086 [Trichinella sp. T9]|nr:hypothetical protein T09_15086 [Trichinella sp. T9]
MGGTSTVKIASVAPRSCRETSVDAAALLGDPSSIHAYTSCPDVVRAGSPSGCPAVARVLSCYELPVLRLCSRGRCCWGRFLSTMMSNITWKVWFNLSTSLFPCGW